MAIILDGKDVSEKIAKKLRAHISNLGTKPKLVIIQVGDLPESNAYISRKKTFGEKIGAIVDHQRFPNSVTQQKLISHIKKLNTDRSVTGVIAQMPFPKHLNKDEIIEAIDPKKDVDGLTSTNLKHLWENDGQGYMPATTKGVIALLDYYKIPIAGRNIVVVGRSFLVGKPTTLAFVNRNATVTVCHSQTKNLKQETKTADILVVAAGKPHLMTKDHVSKGQIVVDVGITAIEEKKLVGDVKFDEVSKIVKAISPVPGGVGPMTVASLFENLMLAYERQTLLQKS